jgi:hypothetical protein
MAVVGDQTAFAEALNEMEKRFAAKVERNVDESARIVMKKTEKANETIVGNVLKVLEQHTVKLDLPAVRARHEELERLMKAEKGKKYDERLALLGKRLKEVEAAVERRKEIDAVDVQAIVRQEVDAAIRGRLGAVDVQEELESMKKRLEKYEEVMEARITSEVEKRVERLQEAVVQHAVTQCLERLSAEGHMGGQSTHQLAVPAAASLNTLAALSGEREVLRRDTQSIPSRPPSFPFGSTQLQPLSQGEIRGPSLTVPYVKPPSASSAAQGAGAPGRSVASSSIFPAAQRFPSIDPFPIRSPTASPVPFDHFAQEAAESHSVSAPGPSRLVYPRFGIGPRTSTSELSYSRQIALKTGAFDKIQSFPPQYPNIFGEDHEAAAASLARVFAAMGPTADEGLASIEEVQGEEANAADDESDDIEEMYGDEASASMQAPEWSPAAVEESSDEEKARAEVVRVKREIMKKRGGAFGSDSEESESWADDKTPTQQRQTAQGSDDEDDVRLVSPPRSGQRMQQSTTEGGDQSGPSTPARPRRPRVAKVTFEPAEQEAALDVPPSDNAETSGGATRRSARRAAMAARGTLQHELEEQTAEDVVVPPPAPKVNMAKRGGRKANRK